MGLAALRSGKNTEAEKFFRDVMARHPDSVWANDTKLKLAEALIAQRRHDEAKTFIRAYLAGGPHGYDAFGAKLLMAKALIGSGDVDAAVNYVRMMAQTATEEARLDEVTALFDELRKRFGVNLWGWFKDPGVQYRISAAFFEASQWDEAARRIRNQVLSRHLHEELRARAEYLLAQCLSRLDHYDEAVKIFERLQRSGRDFPGMFYWLARTYTKMDRWDKAIAIHREMAKRYGRSRTAADVLAKIAFLYVDQGKYERAIKEWEDVIAMRPHRRNLMEAKWYLAWCNYRLKRYDQAIAIYGWMLSHGAKRYNMYDRVRYWRARALVESGREGKGRSLLDGLQGGHGYYAELARRRLKNDKRDYKNFARSTIEGRSRPANNPRVPQARALASHSIHLARAAKLVELGLGDLAAKEVRAAEAKRAGANPLILMELARRSHAHDVARRTAVREFHPALEHFPHGGGQDRYIWEQAYPQAYDATVDRLTSQSPIDEKLVWSIMKAESNFQPLVVSPAGAIGLMQMMPSTARRLARGNRDYDSRELFRPETNIDFGTRYLKDTLWPLFPGDHVAIIASYNAGEEAVGRWLKNKPLREDIEVFIEEIPYAETNLYVKRVLANYWVMQRLYD